MLEETNQIPRGPRNIKITAFLELILQSHKYHPSKWSFKEPLYTDFSMPYIHHVLPEGRQVLSTYTIHNVHGMPSTIDNILLAAARNNCLPQYYIPPEELRYVRYISNKIRWYVYDLCITRGEILTEPVLTALIKSFLQDYERYHVTTCGKFHYSYNLYKENK